MALPTLFANQTQSTGSELDGNFAALGKLTPLPGTISGTNTLSLTLLSNTPTVAAFANGNMFVGVAAGTNTSAVTLAVGAVGPLSVYKDTESGPLALTGGEIVTGNSYGFRYDSTLNTGSGGFHLQSLALALTKQATITFSNTAANTTSEQNVTFANAVVGDLVWLGPPTSVITGVVYMGYVPAAGTVTVRAANVTAASLTPTGGTWRIGIKGAT